MEVNFMAKKQTKNGSSAVSAESKADRFVRVVTPRVGKAVKAISVIGYCTGPSYEFTPEQAEQISKALYAAMNELVDSFAKKSSKQTDFNFE